MDKLLPLLPAPVRKALYVTYLIAGSAGGALLAYYATTAGGAPSWLTGGLAALGAVSVPGFAVAASNVTKPAAVNGVRTPASDVVANPYAIVSAPDEGGSDGDNAATVVPPDDPSYPVGN